MKAGAAGAVILDLPGSPGAEVAERRGDRVRFAAVDDNDHLTVLQTLVDTDKDDLTREAARQCPRQAITITD